MYICVHTIYINIIYIYIYIYICIYIYIHTHAYYISIILAPARGRCVRGQALEPLMVVFVGPDFLYVIFVMSIFYMYIYVFYKSIFSFV